MLTSSVASRSEGKAHRGRTKTQKDNGREVGQRTFVSWCLCGGRQWVTQGATSVSSATPIRPSTVSEARITGISGCEQDFPGAATLSLNRSYRSSQRILAAAAQVIARNPDRKAVEILAEFADEVKLDVYAAPADKAEGEYLVHQIEQMVGGTSYFSLDSGRTDGATLASARSFADFAVLYRLSAQSRPLIKAFDRSGIPYQTVGQASLYTHKAVREVLALPVAAAQPALASHLETVLSRGQTGGSRARPAGRLAGLARAARWLAGGWRDRAVGFAVI